MNNKKALQQINKKRKDISGRIIAVTVTLFIIYIAINVIKYITD